MWVRDPSNSWFLNVVTLPIPDLLSFASLRWQRARRRQPRSENHGRGDVGSQFDGGVTAGATSSPRLIGVLQPCRSTQHALSRFRLASWLRFHWSSSFLLIHDHAMSPFGLNWILSLLSLLVALTVNLWSVIRFQFRSSVRHSATPWLCG